MDPSTMATTPVRSPPDGMTSNLVDPPSLDAILFGTVIVCLVCSTMALVVRLYTKFRSVRRLELEDYFAICAIATFAAYSALMLLGAQAGAGRHAWDVSLAQLWDIMFWVNTTQIFYGPIQWFAKACLLVQLDRLFSPQRRGAIHITIQATLWLNLLFYIGSTFGIVLQCVPREAIWHPWIRATCINAQANCLSTAVINSLSDWIILVLPLWAVWRLKMPLQRKIGLFAVFATGIFACIASICRLVYTVKFFRTDDGTFVIQQLELWTLAEFTTVFLCAHFPLLPRFVQLLVGPVRPAQPSGGKPGAAAGSSYPSTAARASERRRGSSALGWYNGGVGGAACSRNGQRCCPMCGAEQQHWAVAKQVATVEAGGSKSMRSDRTYSRTLTGSKAASHGGRSTPGQEDDARGGIQKTVQLEMSWDGRPPPVREDWFPERRAYGFKGSF